MVAPYLPYSLFIHQDAWSVPIIECPAVLFEAGGSEPSVD
jgi:hypothetical protein